MSIKYVRPFVNAACSVMSAETGAPVSASSVCMRGGPMNSGEVSVLVGITGHLRGTVGLMMPKPTAVGLAQRMLPEDHPNIEDIAASAMAEMANIISGRAGIEHAADGRRVLSSPPLLVEQPPSRKIRAIGTSLFTISIDTNCGPVELNVALAEN